MRRRAAPLLLLALVAVLAFVVWRAQLFTVAAPGDRPRPLALAPESATRTLSLAVSLPCVPVGQVRLESGGHVRIVHFWAPWEQHALSQAQALDSLQALHDDLPMRAMLVCFDPYPSVARWLRRTRVRTPVALDHARVLAPSLPCPSIPFTYVLDTEGRIVVAQPGEVDWLAPATQHLLDSLARTPASTMPTQAETVSGRVRRTQRDSSAWPPNSSAV